MTRPGNGHTGAQEAPEKHKQKRLPGNSLHAGSMIAYLEAHGKDKCKERGENHN